jgi:selenocysteine lyase/cysteine desulfurase
VAYFNCAYMSPLLRAAREAGQRGLHRKSRPWTVRPSDFFPEVDQARALFAELLGASAADIAIVPSVSYGMAVACANVPVAAGQRILLLEEQFPSVVYPWLERARETGAEAVVLPRPADDDWTPVVLDAITDRTAVAALPVCHWTDGALLDLARIGARLREVGAALVVDATQSVGALPFDVAAVQPDFLVAATYKWLLGPYSLGFLYVAPRWHDGRPIEHNWIAREGSEDFARLTTYQEGFQPGARRFDMGEVSNFALMPVAVAGLRQLLDWGVPSIQATIAGTATAIVDHAAALGFRAVPPALRAGHYLGLRLPSGLPAGLADTLARAGVHVSLRGNAVRVTPHVYNDEEDLERLIGALDEFTHAMKAATRRGSAP